MREDKNQCLLRFQVTVITLAMSSAIRRQSDKDQPPEKKKRRGYTDQIYPAERTRAGCSVLLSDNLIRKVRTMASIKQLPCL
jgi:hypothetical protein